MSAPTTLGTALGPDTDDSGTPVAFDPAEAREFLDLVFADVPGLVQICTSGEWIGRFFTTDPAGLDAAVAYAQQRDADRPEGIYFRVTTLDGVPPPRQRGSADATQAVPMFWADVDYGARGHAKPENLPPERDAAFGVIADSALPEPTLLVHSGGGYYPFWLFEQPLPGGADTAALSTRVQALLGDIHTDRDWSYGTGVGDLPRPLRLPGSINRKRGCVPAPCTIVARGGPRIDPAALPEPRTPVRPARREAPRTERDPNQPPGPFGALAETAEWSDIWEPVGWTLFGYDSNKGNAELWKRPGGAQSDYSARTQAETDHQTVVVHSEAAGLPSGAGQYLTKGRVFAHLWHADAAAGTEDPREAARLRESAAARDLIDAAHGRECSEGAAALPEPVLAAIRAAAEQNTPAAREARAWDAVSPGGYDSMIRGATSMNGHTPAVEVASTNGHRPDPAAAPDTTEPSAETAWTPPEPALSFAGALGAEPFDPRLGEDDHALAQGVAMRMFRVLRFNTDARAWLVRNGEVWTSRKDDHDGKVWPLAKLVPLMPPGQTPVPKDAADRTPEHWQAARVAKFRSTAGSSGVASRLRALVSAEHPLTVRDAELDADPDVLWAGGAAWNLRASGAVPTLADIDPATPHMRAAAVCPDPRVPTPAWDAYVATVLPDEQLRTWALRVLSVALTGHSDAAMPILFGPERVGKTVMCERLVTLLGSYAYTGESTLLGTEPPSHVVAELNGRRLVFVDEGPRRGHLATERLKAITGGGEQTGARKFQDPVTFSPSHTLVMTTNDEPRLDDPALVARMRLIPAEADQAAVRAAVRTMAASWADEAPGVLAAMMRHAAAYLADPDVIAKDRAGPAALFDGRTEAEMARDQNPVHLWIERETRRVPVTEGRRADELLADFAQWATGRPELRRNGKPPELTAQKFGRDMRAAGVERVLDRNGRAVWGLAPRTGVFGASGGGLGSTPVWQLPQ